MSASVTVQDKRRLPFVMVTKAAIEAIRDTFDSRRGQTALAVYVALVECANDARSDSFETPRRILAERGMVHVKVLDRYVSELEGLDLVQVERPDGKTNRWTLTDPPAAEGGTLDSPLPGNPAVPGGENPAFPGPGNPGVPGLLNTEKKGKKGKNESEPTASLLSRRDLLDLSNQLADAIKGNDPKATLSPESKTWLDPLRLLIDRDGRTVEEVAAVIDWCQTDDFERRNVLSPGKLRTRFTELWLKAESAGAVQRPNTTPIGFRRQTARPAGWGAADAEGLPPGLAEIPQPQLAAIWAPIAAALAERVDEPTFRIWLEPLHLHAATDDGFILGSKPQQVRWVEDRFGRLLEEEAGKPVRIIECGCAQELAA
jgi:hypothetical protein